MDIKWADPAIRLSREQLPFIRLACFQRLIKLTSEILNFYVELIPASVCAFLFEPIAVKLRSLVLSKYPSHITEEITQLLESVERIRKTHSVPLTMNSRLSILSSGEPDDPKILRKFGLLPQLEPQFDER